ncbi:MAG TPA: hypothetical protein VFM55_08170, partial [Micromonosporaceae bacterium]|nr:hypothetical protein [Micromonosporaceae bacterium]
MAYTHRPALRAGLVASLSLVLLVPAAPASAQASWTVVASPSPSTVASALQDVVIVPSTNVAWAVGYRYDSAAAAYRTLTMRNTGSGWSVVSSPNQGTGYNQLKKVDATATNNVWALGSDGSGNLVERYDGTAWRVVGSPPVGVRDLDVLSANEVWAVGSSGSTTAVARWLNGSWQVVPSLPGAANHLMVFEAVSARAPDDVWAVGWDRDYSVSSRPVSSLVAHYDGSTWTRIPSPNPRTRNTLYGVLALSATDVWAVGVAQNVGGGIEDDSLMMRWDGTSWTTVTTPEAEPGSGDKVLAVTAVSASSIWGIGYYSSPTSGLVEPLLL